MHHMIYKEPGNTKVHRLGVIHLIHFLLGLMKKAGMHSGLKQNPIHDGECGPIPRRQVQTICLIEELRLDYSLFARTPHCNFNSDLTSCYDCILLPLSSLAARGMEIYCSMVFVHAATLEAAEF